MTELIEESKRVLLIDDEEYICSLIVSLSELSKIECSITVSINGKQAEAEIYDREYDLYIIDILLPLKNGVDLAKQVRQLNDNPIIFITGKPMSQKEHESLETEFDAKVFKKPFSTDELIKHIDRLLG